MLAVAFDLLKDINIVNDDDSNPEQFVVIGDQAFFVAEAAETGSELWKTDGTEAGTTLVKDIAAGSAGSAPDSLINLGGMLLFVASDSVHGRELWKSDGSDGGTVLVKDINPGSGESAPDYVTQVGELLYFSADDGTHGRELWKSDGTEGGTVLVKDINPGSAEAAPGQVISANGLLYFVADDGVHGRELWKSDGTEGGTALIEDIQPGIGGASPYNITQVDSQVFFVANETGSAYATWLWKSDGTAEGTVRVDDGIAAFEPSSLVNANGTLYYTTDSGLARSDGTPEGTWLVKDLGDRPQKLIAVGDVVFFVSYDAATGQELWTSDGTEDGTTIVKDIDPGSDWSGVETLMNIDGTLYFWAGESYSSTYYRYLWRTDGTESGTVRLTQNGFRGSALLVKCCGQMYFSMGELWRTDGTPEGTGLVADISVDDAEESSLPGGFTDLNGTLIFSANDGMHGRELWRSDGTADGTWLVTDINVGATEDSSPYRLTVYHNELYFLAYNSVNEEFWTSDGTSAGTYRVKDLFQGDPNGHALSLTEFGDQLLLTATEGSSGENLWTSDGTEEGTAILKVLRETDPHSIAFQYPMPFAEAGGLLYFRGLKPDGEVSSLWRSDGTEAGTFILNDLDGGGTKLSPVALTALGDLMMFRADDGVSGYELWRTDGTNDGTYRVKDINPGSAGSTSAPTSGYPPPAPMSVIGDVLYFSADDGTSGFELWRSDGTEEGTYRLKDIRPGPEGSGLSVGTVHTCEFGGLLYFVADDGVHGYELWKSDGSEGGTVLAYDINPGAGSAQPLYPINVGGTLYFRADNGTTGAELWKLEPGASAPELVADINPSGSSYPVGLTDVNGTLYFTADDGTHGRELWRSDGTEAGTQLVFDFTGDENGSSPSTISALDGRLVVSVLTEEYGRELWIADFAATGDFTMDGKVDKADYDAWRAAFGSTTDLAADGNRNGIVDAADYTVWRDNYVPEPVPSLPGDYNSNGVVGAADYTVWRDTLGGGVATPYDGADGDGDREITESDYLVWKSHFGESSPPPAAVSTSGTAAPNSEIAVREIRNDLAATVSTTSAESTLSAAVANTSPDTAVIDCALLELAMANTVSRRHLRTATPSRRTSAAVPADDAPLLHLASARHHAQGRTDIRHARSPEVPSQTCQDNGRDDLFAAFGSALDPADLLESWALTLVI